VMLDPEQLCGVPRSEWTVDRRFVHAVEMGRPPPWSTMRGVRYRLLVEVALRRGADARRSQLSAGELRRLEAQVALRSMRRLVEAALPRVECASLPCTYQEWMDQQCSKALVRPAATSPSAGQPAGGAGAERATRLTISMGTTSGYCGALMHRMAAKLRDWTSDGDDRPPSSSAPPATVAQAAGRLRILTAVPDPICDSYCRRSYRMVCPGGYERAIASALRKHRAALQLPAEPVPPSGPGQGVAGHLSGDLTLLSFVYAADLDSEWRATLTGWQADSFGHGAHLLFLAATWLEVKGRPTAPEELAWDGKVEAVWKDVLSGCAAAAPTRCVVRSVLESARVETRQLYLAHEAKLLALAAARTVPALPWFNASWSGVRRGEMRHHDHTRIHFGDVGRLFLAQLTLNVLPILLSRPEETLPLLPPPRVEQRINLHRLRARPGG